MPGGFQTTVNTSPAPAVWGDWSDRNPRYFMDAGPGGMVAGVSPAGAITNPQGVVIGRFVWSSASSIDPNSAPTIIQNFAVAGGPVAGLVHREQQGLITQYLSDASMVIPTGFPVTVCTGGGIWIKNEGASTALIGQKAYASFTNGAANFAATGSAATGTITTSTIAAATFSVTGSVTGNQMTITAVTSGTIVNGAFVTGTGLAANTQVVSQISGTAGGIGVYALSIGEQTVAAGTTISGTYGTLTAGGGTGPVLIGSIVTGGTTSAGTIVTQFLTGTGGGSGTYAVNNTQTVASATLTLTQNVETKWIAMSQGLVGELIKVSDKPLG